MVSWFMYDCAEGLILAPGSEIGQAKFADNGLYPNAQEFIDKLADKLNGVAVTDVMSTSRASNL